MGNDFCIICFGVISLPYLLLIRNINCLSAYMGKLQFWRLFVIFSLLPWQFISYFVMFDVFLDMAVWFREVLGSKRGLEYTLV